nr:MAG TPA: hypothetical protein [Caudoviricetes sp.]
MKIYDEITKEELTAPDESKGYLYESQIKTGMTEDTYEVMEGTVTEDCPNGLRRLIPGHAVYEACQFYHTYTDEEIKRMEEQAAAEQAAKDREERIGRIDSIDAQVTYTAMMTDTLMEETNGSEGSGSDGAADSTDNKEA